MSRAKKLKISLFANLLVKGLSILVNLAMVPLLLNYFGVEKYGVWLTIYALVGWLNMFDLGLGNGLKLKLTEAFSRKKNHQIKKLISSAYMIIGTISLVLIIIYLLSIYFVEWEVFLGLTSQSNFDLKNSISFLILAFILLLSLKLIGVIYSSLQLPFVDSLIKVSSQVLFLILLVVLLEFDTSRLYFKIAIISTAPLLLIYLLLSIHFFFVKASFLNVSKKSFSKKITKSIISPGVSFFMIQISSIVLYSTDNLIIVNLINSAAVTEYSISYKYFGLPYAIFNLYIATHWPAFIDALSKNNYDWIKSKIRLFKYLFLTLFCCYVILYYLYDFVVNIWINDENVKSDHFLNLMMITYYLISGYATIYIYIINASGKIALQKYLYIVIAIINIPLSMVFVKLLGLGNSGVILASSFCLLILMVLMPIQSSKILNNDTKGIWAK